MVRLQIASQDNQAKAAMAAQNRQFQAMELAQKTQDAAADRAARQNEKKMDLAREIIIHATTPGVGEMLQSPAVTGVLPS